MYMISKLTTQFWFIKGLIGENILFGVKKYKFEWVRTQWEFSKA
jgi:hypothetical protein